MTRQNLRATTRKTLDRLSKFASAGAGANCTDRPTSESTTADLDAVRRGFFAGCALSNVVHAQPQHVLAWIGAPVRSYLLSDVLLDTFPADRLKLVVVANGLQINSTVRAAIEALFERGETLPVPVAHAFTPSSLTQS